MWKLFQIEVYKIFRKPRTYLAFAIITGFIFLIQLGLLVNGKEFLGFMLGTVNDMMEFNAKDILNGYWVCFAILNLLLIHVPILVALVAGDIVSGEAAMGTLRLMAIKPVSRAAIILAKFFASAVYVFLLLLWIAFISLFVSLLVFGSNNLMVAKVDDLRIIETGDILWRYCCAFGFAFIAMMVVAALALLLSTVSKNSIGPIVATVGIVILCTLISEMEIPLYQKYIRPYLFTSYMLGWKGFFYINYNEDNETIRGSIENLPAILKSIGALLAYIVLFVTASVMIFKRKDILS
ncbi:MAG: ABC transporter permease subunit [Bacteroidetes bacterium]|nr:ABC transporter permease subunit [Bacteroidota bacterium]